MTIKLGIIMSPIDKIKPRKDTSLAILLAAQSRGYTIYYMEPHHISYQDKHVYAQAAKLKVSDSDTSWYQLHTHEALDLSTLDVILMREDPPFDMNYIYTTYMLSLLQEQGVLIVNNPQALRDANEKFITTWFPELCPSTLISANQQQLRHFCHQEKDIIVKPLDGMGGQGVFRMKENDPNQTVILETLTHHGSTPIVAQTYIKEVVNGDKRIILINGEPIPYALARIPAKGETRANLAVGGTAKGVELTKHDYTLCEHIAPVLRKLGLLFVGLDVIGNYITEINVTSPTCVRELEQLYSIKICDKLLDVIENALSS